jgi:DNA polymerase III delta prime subunit
MAYDKLWITKYKPTNSNSLIGNKSSISIIKNWLKNYDILKKDKNNPMAKANLLLIGSHGLGKTTIVKILLKEAGYNINFLKLSSIKNNKNIKDYIYHLTKNTNVSHAMINNKKIKNAILIDKIETITSTIEKKSLEDLRKNNEKYRFMPIIYISDTKHTKFLSNLKKSCIVIYFNNLKNEEIIDLLNKIIVNEKINIKSYKVKQKILNYVQGDIRRLINILQDLYFIYDHNEITEDCFKKYTSHSHIKEINIGLFNSATILFNKIKSIDDILILYELEKTKLPLMIHEHYYTYILNHFKNKSDQLETIKKISDSISFGDSVEYHIYNDQDWDMQDFHGFYSCCYTSYLLNSCSKNYKSKSFNKNDFPQDLNKTSIKNINKKNISNISGNFYNTDIYDYIQINKIIKYLLKNKNIKEIGRKLKYYNMTLNQIDSLLKIDKIINTKNNNLTIKNKKELINYI